MEENSQSSNQSTRTGQPRTRKTVSLTRGQLLEILTQDFHNLELAGFVFDVTANHNGKLKIEIDDVDMINGVIVEYSKPPADTPGNQQ